MKISFLPKSSLGKWSVRLTILFLMVLFIFFTFMLLGLVSFDIGHWWDLTVAIAVPVEIISFILSILAIKKTNERSYMVYLSSFIGVCIILFVLLHSLFIHD